MRAAESFFHSTDKALRILLIFCISVFLPANAMAQERQYKIEAAYLYSFFNYVTWPGYATPQSMQQRTICVFGEDPILSYLDYARRKMAGEYELTLRSVGEGENTAGCSLFFLRHRISSQMVSSLPPTTLTVFKPDDPLDRGGMIELNEDDERISIKINQPLLERGGFKVSSRLLGLSQVVK